MAFEFNLMRSLIYVGLAKEEYRPKLEEWLYKYHVPDPRPPRATASARERCS